MAEYQRTPDADMVMHNGKRIFHDITSGEWAAYMSWRAAGNVPDDFEPPPLPRPTNAEGITGTETSDGTTMARREGPVADARSVQRVRAESKKGQ